MLRAWGLRFRAQGFGFGAKFEENAHCRARIKTRQNEELPTQGVGAAAMAKALKEPPINA